MKPEDLLWLALGAVAVAAEFAWQHRQGVVILIALGIGVGIMNDLAALTAKIHTELDAFGRLLESRFQPPNLDLINRLAAAELLEKSEAHKCPECGALPVFKTFLEAAAADKKGALAYMMLSGGFTNGSGYWHYSYHLENCSRREPGEAVVEAPPEKQE
jgi:hypothetical protein